MRTLPAGDLPVGSVFRWKYEIFAITVAGYDCNGNCRARTIAALNAAAEISIFNASGISHDDTFNAYCPVIPGEVLLTFVPTE